MQIEESTLWIKPSPENLVSRLNSYLYQQGFKRGATGNNPYIKTKNENLLFVVVYVDDIIFESNTDKMN